MTGTVKLYQFPLSQPSRCINWLLKLGNIPHESITVNLLSREQKKPEYLAKHPAGVVPMIETACGVCAPESGAILIYLCNAFGYTEYYPADEIIRLKINSVLFSHNDLARKVTTTLIFPCIHVCHEKGDKATLDDCKQAILAKLGELKEAFGKLDTLLAGKTYIAGTDKPTLGDLQAICELNQIPRMGAVLPIEILEFQEYPNIQQYVKRMASVPHHDELLQPFAAFQQLLPKA